MRTSVSTLLTLALLAGCYPQLDIKGDGANGDPGLDSGIGGTGGADDCTVWQDGDSDGFGAGDATVVPCDDVPEGYADNNEDCDDADPDSNPDAAERCDEKDNDCDGLVDNDIQTTWYTDADGDGFGVAEDPLEDCDPPDGYADNADDCDDARTDVNPDADEVCDTVDNDCDTEVDEDDAVDAPTWYGDSDGDGYGLETDTRVQCEQPEGYLDRAGDCDDGEPDINPDAIEVCDGLDNDCDTLTDDDDDSLDASTGTTHWLDGDSDGYGAGAALQACVLPANGVENDEDCDDGEASINPDAAEVCDELDNDCDGDIDDDDASLDTSTGTVFYRDGDRDGYGDASSPVEACEQPTGAVSDATDCEDGDGDINPGATEVCDEVDNDCDGDIDDDDTSLDTSTQTTWYADTDSDGEGDPDVSVDACSQPSGYVDNGDDCDDSDANDLDADGIQDCADDDRDGDGLRNDWDVEPDDDSVTRGPTGGLGTDGAYSVSSGSTDVQEDWTDLSAAVASGATSLSVVDSSFLSSGDEILILVQQGSGAGTYEYVFVSNVSGTTLTVEPPLTNSYSGSAVVLVQRVPHYTTVSIAGTLTTDSWEDAANGVVVFRAEDAVAISGTVDAQGAGFEGGTEVRGNNSASTTGESYNGTATADGSNYNGGGGAYYVLADRCYCGAGGGYGGAGDDGSNRYYSSVYWVEGGDTYGNAALTTWFFGSGGGGGSPDSESDGNSNSNYTGGGGNGGGVIALYSATSISVSGRVDADGDDGEDASSAGGEIGGGGGGAGGQILLAAPSVALSGTVVARGGDGGDPDSSGLSCNNSAGDGGAGRIRVLYSSSGSGSTNPAASTGTYTD